MTNVGIHRIESIHLEYDCFPPSDGKDAFDTQRITATSESGESLQVTLYSDSVGGTMNLKGLERLAKAVARMEGGVVTPELVDEALGALGEKEMQHD